MVEKDIRFTVSVNDQATAQLQMLKTQMDALNRIQVNLKPNVQYPNTTPGVPTTFASDQFSIINRQLDQARTIRPRTTVNPNPGGQNQLPTKPQNSPNTMLPGEWARPLRAVGAYRASWFAGQDMGSTAMKGAGMIFILQAIGETAKKMLDALVEASPALKAEFKILKVTLDQLLRPIGDVLAIALKPFARMALNASIIARQKAMNSDGSFDMEKYYSTYLANFTGQMLGLKPGLIDDLAVAFDGLFKQIEFNATPLFMLIGGAGKVLADNFNLLAIGAEGFAEWLATFDSSKTNYGGRDYINQDMARANVYNATVNLQYMGNIQPDDLNARQQMADNVYDRMMALEYRRAASRVTL